MKILIEKIGDDGLDIDEALPHAWIAGLLGSNAVYQPSADGRVKVHVSRNDDVVQVHGHAMLNMVSPCSRCLRTVDVAMNTRLEVTLMPPEEEPKSRAKAKDAKAHDDDEVLVDDIGISTYQNHEIDLFSVVHDEVLLELPMVALCSESCAGLCPSCGENLNEGACTCAPAVDLRWTSLQRVKIN